MAVSSPAPKQSFFVADQGLGRVGGAAREKIPEVSAREPGAPSGIGGEPEQRLNPGEHDQFKFTRCPIDAHFRRRGCELLRSFDRSSVVGLIAVARVPRSAPARAPSLRHGLGHRPSRASRQRGCPGRRPRRPLRQVVDAGLHVHCGSEGAQVGVREGPFGRSSSSAFTCIAVARVPRSASTAAASARPRHRPSRASRQRGCPGRRPRRPLRQVVVVGLHVHCGARVTQVGVHKGLRFDVGSTSILYTFQCQQDVTQ